METELIFHWLCVCCWSGYAIGESESPVQCSQYANKSNALYLQHSPPCQEYELTVSAKLTNPICH
jgi:hypothetical protein